MDERVTVRQMKPGEEPDVCALVARVFDRFVAPGFAPEGVEEFYRYAEPGAMARRCGGRHQVILGEEDGQLLGMIELRGFDHIAMLFVESRGRGLGRALVERALQICREGNSGPREVSVHASLYAVPIYGKLGFERAGPERTENGITFVPMVFKLEPGG